MLCSSVQLNLDKLCVQKSVINEKYDLLRFPSSTGERVGGGVSDVWNFSQVLRLFQGFPVDLSDLAAM